MGLTLQEPTDGQVVSNPTVNLASKGPCSLGCLFPVKTSFYGVLPLPCREHLTGSVLAGTALRAPCGGLRWAGPKL